MAALATLHRAVAAAVASKRLGVIVFVRCTVQDAEAKNGVPRLAQTLAAVREWVGQKVDRLYATSHSDGGQIAVTLQFAEGATALVSFVQSRPRGDGVDLLVLGNHGSLTHDAGHAELSDEPFDVELPPPEPALVALIEKALKSGKPEVVGGKP